MKQRTITAAGFNVSYIAHNPDATEILFFFHGNSGSSNTWLQQLESSLLASYRLIAFDFPLHNARSAFMMKDVGVFLCPIVRGHLCTEVQFKLNTGHEARRRR
jgi:pimeloyl-ACP methyl ester carboxylesterase